MQAISTPILATVSLAVVAFLVTPLLAYGIPEDVSGRGLMLYVAGQIGAAFGAALISSPALLYRPDRAKAFVAVLLIVSVFSLSSYFLPA